MRRKKITKIITISLFVISMITNVGLGYLLREQNKLLKRVVSRCLIVDRKHKDAYTALAKLNNLNAEGYRSLIKFMNKYLKVSSERVREIEREVDQRSLEIDQAKREVETRLNDFYYINHE